MPIVKKKPDAEVNRSPLPVGDLLEEKKIYKTATANSAITPPEALVLYMEGMPWSVTYYSQLIDRHDDVREVDITQNAALQQYRKLNHIELRVQSDLAESYDESTGRNDVTGTAIAVGMIPNTYDYFVTDAGTQGQGLFMVTSSTRKTYNNGSVYEIDYILVGYIDAGSSKERYDAIEYRSTKEYYFHKERLQAGQVALLTTEEHGSVGDLRLTYQTLTRAYVNAFMSASDRLLICPDFVYLYDSRAAAFAMAILDSDIEPKVNNIHRVSHDRDPYLSLPSIWNILLTRDISMIPLVIPKVGKVSRSFFAQNSFLMTTNCWNVDRYVYPDIESARLIFPRMKDTGTPSGWIGPFENEMNAAPSPMYRYADKDIPVFHPANKDSYYVLSSAFYSQYQPGMSLMEILVTDYINGRTIHLGHLSVLAKSWSSWTSLERFYFTPVLLVLLKEAIAGYY